MPDEKWKDQLRTYFEHLRIIEKCKHDTLEHFAQFTEFIAEPAYEALEEELKPHGTRVGFRKDKGSSLVFDISFPRSKETNFSYIIMLPRNSVELKLNRKTVGRRTPKALTMEEFGPFFEGLSSIEIMKLTKERLLEDIIARYRDFRFRSLTLPD
ncbi:MAG: hypothetical protein MUQ00_16715 [Candidatus Aminicenantes bacterium]|nr:hypothetical protein [Candidatus Aminicenantes bacterium]